jgi:tetratricopeptide (TPR) repeat protein
MASAMGSSSAPLRWVPFLLSVLLFVAAPVRADTLLVVPFENTGRVAELDWVGESFAEGLTEDLMGNGQGLVTRDERLAALERMGLPSTAPLTRASILRLGEEVGADWVALGRFSVQDNHLDVGMQLLNVDALTLSPWTDRQAPFARLLQVQRGLAWDILHRLNPAFPQTREQFQQALAPIRVSAFESYLRGLLAMSREHQRRYFYQAYRLQPDYSPAIFRLALIDFEEQNYAAAAGWFGKIPDADHLAPEAAFYLSLCEYFQESFGQAAQTLLPVAHRFPVPSVWNNLGVFASREGRAADAVDYFSRALADDPGDADACFNLGLHYTRLADWPAAARRLKDCTDLNPGDTDAWLLYAHVLDRLGRSQEAQTARQQVGEEAKELDLAALDLDRLHQRLSVPATGTEAPEVSLARARHVEVHIERGQDLLGRGELQQAQEEFTQAILLDPAAYRAHYLLADIYLQQGRLPESVSELKASLWSRDTSEARLRLAKVYLAQNQPDQARRQVEAALALDPDNSEARALGRRIPLRTADTPAEDSSIE